ncbi:MAG: NAD-binding protein [Rhodothermales bacterium]|nr:NAD-binding protein [Rhodothermales bacterium]MBO6778247.1 NAD-binding protein [Rhodothermales bacterium]
MKLVSTQLSYFFSDKRTQRNVRALLKYVAFVAVVVVVFAELFHLIMVHVEGQEHSWFTGLYWTLTVMSTLGFGDITFQSDIGRVFSMVVLMSGVVLLLIVLPFAFIRFFYAPWLEAQIRHRAPERVPPGTTGHVIICDYETIAPGLIERLKSKDIPYFVLEPDPTLASNRYLDGISVVVGELDNRATYESLNLDRARMVIANRADTVNTSIILTVREVAPEVPIVATAGREHSVDVLKLSGADHVLCLKRFLGEQLASRVAASHARSHVIGNLKDLLIAELPLHRTPLAGRTIRETRLREISGVSIIGVWEKGRMTPSRPDTQLTHSSVLVIIGTQAQLDKLDELLFIYNVNENPVLIIGGGVVGRAAARALQRQDIPVHVVEQNPVICDRARPHCKAVFTGDAEDYDLLVEAGVLKAPSVLLTTHDDAMNIFLTSYCRQLNPELRLVSRITHERNLEAIHRAGADFVLSYASLGVESITSIVEGKDLIMLGEGVDLFSVPLPASLHGKSLAETGIGARTGLNVVAIQDGGEVRTNPPASTVLEPGTELLMLGSNQQRQEFLSVFG